MSAPLRRVLPPDTRFLELAALVESAGWARDPTAASGLASLRPGEPELAAWFRGAARLTYTANPVVGLRVLELSGTPEPEQQQLFDSLPGLDTPALAQLLASTDPRQLMLACFAVAELELIELLPRIAALRTHEDPRVAGAAERTHQRLGTAVLNRGLQKLATRRRLAPDRDALFETLPDPRMRRQQLRRMAAELEPGDPTGDAMLRSGLDDRDWEVRVTAMLLAARLGRASFAKTIAKLELPTGARAGLDRRERALLRALVRASLACLSERPSPHASATAAALADLRRLILARDEPDEAPSLPESQLLLARMWIHALTRPLALTHASVPRTRGIVEADAGWVLRGTDCRMVPIGVLPHWLGDGITVPIRHSALPQGFWISVEPQPAVTVEQLDSVLASLAERSDAPISVPTHEQWEMALRGPDGRLWPGGMSPERSPNTVSSWGLHCLTNAAEWCRTGKEGAHESYKSCGGGRRPACSSPAEPGAALRFRVVLIAECCCCST